MITSLVKAAFKRDITVLSSSDRLWGLFGQLPAASGITVGGRGAMSAAPVWQAVSQISGSIASCPIYVRRREPSLGPEASSIDFGHRTYMLVAERPSPRINPQKFWRRFVVHALLWNRAYIWVERSANGRPTNLWHLLPDRTQWIDKDQIYKTEVSGAAFGRPDQRIVKGLYSSEVIEVEGPQTDNPNELEWISKARDSIGLLLAAEKFNSSFFAHGGQPGGVLSVPPDMPREQQENVIAGWRQMMEQPGQWFRTAIEADGVKWRDVMHNAEDSQMHELREDQVYDVARWFNLPPSRLGLRDATSYGSKAEDNANYLDQTLQPWFTAIEAELKFKLLTNAEISNRTHFFKHDTTQLNRLSMKERAEANEILIRSGQRSFDEARAADNLNPLPDGIGKQFVIPANYTVLMKIEPPEETLPDDDDDRPEPPDDQPPDEDEDQDGDQEDSDQDEEMESARQNELHHAIKRLTTTVKREANQKQPMRFCSWWDDTQATLLAPIKLLDADVAARFAADIESQLAASGEHTLASRITEICDVWNNSFTEIYDASNNDTDAAVDH